MVFDGFRKVFNRIGDLTINSSRKVGGGVQTPVEKIGEIRSNRNMRTVKKIKPVKSDSKPIFETKKDSKSEPLFKSRPSRTTKRKRMDEEEIEIFKELIDKKYEGRTRSAAEEEKKEALHRASLEQVLQKETEKKSLDPKLILVIGGVSFAVMVVAVLALGFGIGISLLFGAVIAVMALFIFFLPNIRRGRKSSEAARELPFALRQMATELRAGIGLHDSMQSIAASGYGPLSEEFARTLEEIRYGETTEKALLDMSDRIDSDGLKRAIYQITRTLSSGGDLAMTLGVIAEDTAYELRMKLKDYAQKLNSFTMIYMFIAILGPVITMVMVIAASTVMGAIISPMLLLVLFLFLFPAIVAFMAFMIKRLEPQI